MGSKDKHITSITKWPHAAWLLLFYLISAQSIVAQTHVSGLQQGVDSIYSIDINIFNRYDDHLIDSTYMGNDVILLLLDSLMQDTTIINHTQTINVISSSSIEGRESYNKTLSMKRMNTIEAKMRQRYDYIEPERWAFRYIPENWTHLRKAVVDDNDVPSRDNVLSIIDMKEQHPDTKEALLKSLDDGKPWGYIHKNILPLSRGSVSMLFQLSTIRTVEPVGLLPIRGCELTMAEMPSLEISQPSQNTYSRPILSIRSNLLLDITSTLNIAIEAPITPRLSLSAEYVNPWWKSWNSDFTWQIQSLYFDFRYWLGNRGSYNNLTGLSIGAYAGSGCYDIQPFSENGVQGEYTDFGVTVSYAHKLWQSNHWLMEYNLSLGYLTTHYRNYYTADETNEYGDIKVLNYPWSEETLQAPLPTRIGVTLCYLINLNGVKKRGDKL